MNLDDAIATLEQRKVDYVKEYRDMVIAAAEDELRDVDEIERILDGAKKTPGQFSNDVDTRKRRNALRAERDQKDAVLQQQAELREKVNEANQILEEAVRVHQQTCFPLQAELERVQQRLMKIHGIDRELFNGCSCPELKDRMAHLRRLVNQELNHRDPELEAIETLADNLSNLNPDDPRNTGEIKSLKDRIAFRKTQWEKKQGPPRPSAAQKMNECYQQMVEW